MIPITVKQIEALSRSGAANLALKMQNLFCELAQERRLCQSERAAKEWIIQGTKIAKRRNITDYQEIALLVLLVSELGPNFDVHESNSWMAPIWRSRKPATTIAEILADYG